MVKTWITPRGQHLEYVRKIGEGSFGTAYLVHTRRGSPYCLKEVVCRTSDDKAREELMAEVVCLQSAQHTNVVRLIENWWGPSRFFILMEYTSNGSLEDIIKRFKGSKTYFTETKVLHFVQEIAEALLYLHGTLRIMHRDLKPANILLDEHWTAKIADFGTSCFCEGDANAQKTAGTRIRADRP